MESVKLEDVIRYARQRHGIPAAYATSFYDYWTERNWISTTGKIIFNWRVKFDWWVLDNKDKLIITTKHRNDMIYAEEQQRKDDKLRTEEDDEAISYEEYLKLKKSQN